MSLTDFANLSQIVAAIAVVASLIYLAVQVGQSERNQRAMIQQGRADRASGGAMAIAAPGMATIFRKGMMGDPGLAQEEFDQRAFDSWIAGARTYMAAPGLRAIWKLTAAQYCAEYREFVEKNIINRPVAAPADAFAAWRAPVGEELGNRK